MKAFTEKLTPERTPITPDQYYQILNYKIGLEVFLTNGFFKEYKSDCFTGNKWASEQYDKLVAEIKSMDEYLMLNEPLEFGQLLGRRK